MFILFVQMCEYKCVLSVCANRVGGNKYEMQAPHLPLVSQKKKKILDSVE